MSVPGYKQTLAGLKTTSASPPGADLPGGVAEGPFLTQPVWKRSLIFCVTGLWVWMICRDGFCGFGDLFG